MKKKYIPGYYGSYRFEPVGSVTGIGAQYDVRTPEGCGGLSGLAAWVPASGEEEDFYCGSFYTLLPKDEQTPEALAEEFEQLGEEGSRGYGPICEGPYVHGDMEEEEEEGSES